MKLSFFFVLIAILAFIMTVQVDCVQKRQEFEGEDEDGPGDPSMYFESRTRPDDRTR